MPFKDSKTQRPQGGHWIQYPFEDIQCLCQEPANEALPMVKKIGNLIKTKNGDKFFKNDNLFGNKDKNIELDLNQVTTH